MPVIPLIEWDPVPFNVSATLGRVAIEGSSIGGKGRRPYGSPAAFEQLLQRPKQIPGVSQVKNTYPDISLEALVDGSTFAAYFALMDEVVTQIRKRNFGDVLQGTRTRHTWARQRDTVCWSTTQSVPRPSFDLFHEAVLHPPGGHPPSGWSRAA